MVEQGHGHFAVVLLRPAYEELVWVEYLDKIPNEARELVPLLGLHEMTTNLNAQNEFAGLDGMNTIGFTQRYVKVSLARDRIAQRQIRELGACLGWRKNALRPSMEFLSRKVGREKDYKFLYQATSRFVHFSTAEIFRRAWGQKGKIEIHSKTFSNYWETFAIYWGFRIFLYLLIECNDLLEQIAYPKEKLEELMKALSGFRQVPIITPEELGTWPQK